MKEYESSNPWRKQMTVEASLATRRWRVLPSSSSSDPSPTYNGLIFQTALCVSLFCDRVITTWLVRCLGPSRSVRKGAVGPAPRNLGADREGGKKSAWCPGPSGPYDKGKGDWYMASLVTENCHLPYQTALVMLTILPGVRSRGYQLQICVEEAFASKCVGCLPPIFAHGFIPSHTYLLLSFTFLLLHRVMVTSTD